MKRKFNFGLLAFVLGLGLVVSQSAFTPSKATVTHGVLDEDSMRYEITAGLSNPSNSCGVQSIPCRVTFDNASDVPYQEGGRWYVDKSEDLTTAGSGGYIQ